MRSSSLPASPSARRRLPWAAVALLGLLGPVGESRAGVPRTVVVELFGSPACAGCPAARDALQTLEVELTADSLTFVEYHTEEALANESSRSRGDFYGISGLPTIRLDGTTELVGGGNLLSEYRAAVRSRVSDPSPVRVDAVFFFERESRLGSVVVNLEVAPGETIADSSVVVRAILHEDEVDYCCGAGGTGTWDRVVRDVLPATPLTVSQAGEFLSFEQNFILDRSWNTDKLHGTVLVQRDSDGFVLNAVSGEVSGALEPVPTSGLDTTRVSLQQNVPNPMRTGTQILFFLPDAGWARLQVFNVRGQVVRVLTDGPRTAGTHPMEWNGADFRGRPMAPGVYFYRLETSSIAITKRLTLIH